MSLSEEQSHPDWHQATNFLVGYGSLLSADSRLRFSDNPYPAISVTIQGYQRSWITRSINEQQTYVGVLPLAGGKVNAHCVPITLNPSLQKREQDYQFVQLSLEQVQPNGCQHTELWHHLERSDVRLWICVSLKSYPASPEYPIHLSYIDTCLSGCLHHYRDNPALSVKGLEEAHRFIASTMGWQDIHDDRQQPRYPRAAALTSDEHQVIDRLLAHYGYYAKCSSEHL